ncbi:MAG: hypothetical protein E7672_02550 [Ruminococcaceae bacterium]|nr:hypothetical protein [Oscillospiraceae bacterium]
MFTVKVYDSIESWINEKQPILEEQVKSGEIAPEPYPGDKTEMMFNGWRVKGEDRVFDFEEKIYSDIIIYADWKSIYADAVITYYTENDGGYAVHEVEEAGKIEIGVLWTIDPIVIPGYTFNGEKSIYYLTAVDGVNNFEMYYDRAEFDYEVQFIDSTTGEYLCDPYRSSALFGDAVSYTAEEFEGYTLEGEETRTIVIDAEDGILENNLIVFAYAENDAVISYQIVGETDGGFLDVKEEAVKMFSGVAKGSFPTVYKGYLFGGWYYDEACTEPVPDAFVDGNNIIKPAKELDLAVADIEHYKSDVYYAKIIRGYVDLTITTDNADETFIYRVVGIDSYTDGIDVTVAASGGEITIEDLPLGEYRVSEISSWSWRYSADSTVKDIVLSEGEDNTVGFSHTREIDKWLSGAASLIRNWFGF